MPCSWATVEGNSLLGFRALVLCSSGRGETGRYWGALWPSLSPTPPPQQIKSDKQQLGSVIYSIQGPGVDEEPRNVFSIDKFTGRVYLNATLDREKTDRFRVGPGGGKPNCLASVPHMTGSRSDAPEARSGPQKSHLRALRVWDHVTT